jgi:hypothetical protein
MLRVLSLLIVSLIITNAGQAMARETGAQETLFEERLIAEVPKGYSVKDPSIDWWMTSRNGKSLAYVARRRMGNDIRECIIFGNLIGPYLNFVMRPALSPDGKKLAYLAAIRRGKGEFPLYILIGQKSKQIQFKERGTNSNWNPIFSPDGMKVVFQMERNGKHANVVSSVAEASFIENGQGMDFADHAGTIGPNFDVVDRGIFSPDSKRLAYSAKDRGSWFIVLDGHKGPEFDDAWPPVFSPDSTKVAYRASKNGKWLVMIGNQPGPVYDRVGKPAFSPDSSVVAYSAVEKGKAFLIVGDKKIEKEKHCDNVVFSRDGSEVNCWDIEKAGKRQSMLIWDEVGPRFDEVGLHPAFSPDVKTAAYWIKDGNKQRIAVGKKKGPKFDAVDRNPVFSPDGSKVGYVALKGREFWWKVMNVR